MGSHDPFGHFKHKLWPKEGPRVELPIWLLTTKSWESLRLTCVQVACNIPMESSWQGIQLCLRPNLNRRSACKIMGLQSCRSPNFGNFETPTLESQDKMTFECWSHGQAQSILQGGRWWFSPSSVCDESCESIFARGLSMHQKRSNYALTNLLFGLCKSAWIIDACHSS
jgi:hypothetical protein